MQTGDATRGSGLASREIHILMIAVMTGMFLGAIDGTIVITAMPAMVGDLGNLSQAPWIHVGFLLTQTIATPIIGKLSDIYGRKLTFQVTIVAFIVASVACAAAQDMTQLIILRALQGIGAGGLLSLPMAIVGDILPPFERVKYQGYIAGTFAVASLLGPLAGGFFVDFLHWRWVFLVNLPIGIMSLIVVQRRLHIDRLPQRRSIDYLGAIALTFATAPLVVALLHAGEHYGWSSATTITLLAISAVSAAAFLFIEMRADDPILPLSLFSNRIVRPTMIGGFVVGIGMYGVMSFAGLFMQVVNGVTATAAGLLMAPNMLGVLISSIVSGRLIARTGNYKPYPATGAMLLALGTVLLATMDTGTHPASVAARLFLTGVGIGLIGPSITLIVQNAVPYRDLGVAMGGLSFIRSLGGALGTAVLGAIYSTRLNELIPRYVGDEAMAQLPDPEALRGQPTTIHELPEPVRSNVIDAFADTITYAMWVGVPMLLIAAAAFALIPRIPLRDRHEDAASAPAPEPVTADSLAVDPLGPESLATE